MFMFIMCFQCVNGLIYSILYTHIAMYYVLQHSQGPTLSCQQRVIWNVDLSWRCCPWRSMLTVSVHILGLWAEPFPSTAAHELGKRVISAIRHQCFCLVVERRNFCMNSTEQNNVKCKTSVWDQCLKCNTNCRTAVNPPRALALPPRISTDTRCSLDCWQGLIGTWSVDIILHSKLVPNHVPLDYTNGGNPMHLSLCNTCSCLWCSSAICRENPVIASGMILWTFLFKDTPLSPKSFWVSKATGSPCHTDVILPQSHYSVNQPAFNLHCLFLSLSGNKR